MKKLLLSAAISFGLNVFFTVVIFVFNFIRIQSGTKFTWAEKPFYLSIKLLKIVFPQFQQQMKSSDGANLLFLLLIYIVNIFIYTLPIYGIWWFISRKKKPKPVLSEEPPPPMF